MPVAIGVVVALLAAVVLVLITERRPMPFKSEKQRKYMHAKHPKIAERWEKEKKRKSARSKKARH